MSKNLLLLLLVLIAFTSCQKNAWEDRFVDKIEGHWTYDKAKYQAKTFKSENRITDFENDNIYFHKDGTLEIINEVDNTYLTGIYSFERTTNLGNNWDGNNTTITHQVQISLTDTATNELYQELWDQFTITKKVVRYEIEKDNRPFYFKLCKQSD